MDIDATRMDWKRYAGRRAWPTVLLWAATLLGVALSVSMVITGRWPIWLGALVDFVAAYVVFTPMHEAAHGNVRGGHARWRGLEAVVGWTSGLLLLAPFPAFTALHLRHHSHTNDAEQDPDMWVAGRGAASVAARCLTIVPHYYWDFMLGPTARSGGGSRARRSTMVVVAVLAVVVAVAAALGGASLVLWLWVLPAVAASGVLAFAFDWLPHHPHRERARGGNTRLLPGGWLNVALLGQSYHLVHHLYPRVPFYDYARCLRSARDR